MLRPATPLPLLALLAACGGPSAPLEPADDDAPMAAAPVDEVAPADDADDGAVADDAVAADDAAAKAYAPEDAPNQQVFDDDDWGEEEVPVDSDVPVRRRERGERPERPEPVKEPRPDPKGGGRPTVIFFILDTVRADHTSLCDYERPTTPWLDTLAERSLVSHSCHTYSPGTWTIPSHASYFTGQTVPVHESDSMGHTYEATTPVLSEIMRDQGYQSLMVAANPTLSEKSGLQRGFEFVAIGNGLQGMRGDDVARTVKKVLEKKADPDKPLFLFVNILDAHDPYPEVPRGMDWVPPQPELEFDVFEKNQNSVYHKFIRHELEPDAERAYLRQIRNGYDYGIWRADHDVAQIMTLLRREGWLENGFRFVLTADHGEFLGEHQLLRHGCYVWEPVVKVPFVYFDTSRKEALELPEPFSAINAFHLVSTGELPATPIVANSVSKRREMDVKVCADMAALWKTNTDKVVWFEGSFYHFDLSTDPGELGHEAIGNHPWKAKLEAFAKEQADHLARIRGKAKDRGRVAELAALGYVE
ncbi:MAG: sulfatase-like hydrolase/transferase [Alphaproteobacteria bacterium]|nr:sulfatase-like hydrolase/transferase [Alphaproteobacteria bacterium]